mmetsp:Transcript_11981/g.12042  ORF Transcript_11981/g.12042 Transcript_11981/m.12042 type:complete len:386 (-) Transcript_11981:164-1321(-)
MHLLLLFLLSMYLSLIQQIMGKTQLDVVPLILLGKALQTESTTELRLLHHRKVLQQKKNAGVTPPIPPRRLDESANAELAAKLARRNMLNESPPISPGTDENKTFSTDSASTIKVGSGKISSNASRTLSSSEQSKEAATAELAAKLARRNMLNEAPLVPASTDDSSDTNIDSTTTRNRGRTVTCAETSKELAEKLERRNQINDGVKFIANKTSDKEQNVYREFPEFSVKHVNDLKERFATLDFDQDDAIRLEDVKKLLEALGEPTTHFTLRSMMKDINMEKEKDISFRDFLAILRRQKIGKMDVFTEAMKQQSVNVHEVGVSGAKSFFEAKQVEAKAPSSSEALLRAQQDAAKAAKQEAEDRRKKFQEKCESFGSLNRSCSSLGT